MKEGDGRFLQLSTLRQGQEGELVQDGFKEKLLCNECEARLQKWEDYFARIVNQKRLLDLEKPCDGRKWVRVTGFDYAKTKLFFLSILWRIHAARHANFRMIHLGEAHGKRLRDMLLGAVPGSPWEYGCLVATPYVDFGDERENQVRLPVTVTPENVRWIHGLRFVRMQIDGMFFQFVVGSADLMRRTDAKPFFLQQDGTMVVWIEDLTNIEFLRNSWGKALGFIGRTDLA